MIARAIRQDLTVQKDHQVEIHSPELKLGDQVEVILRVHPKNVQSHGVRTLLGAGKGSFASPEEADRFIREERNLWN